MHVQVPKCHPVCRRAQLKNELASKKAQWEALRYAAAEPDVELEEECLDGSSAAAAIVRALIERALAATGSAAAAPAVAAVAASALTISKEQRAELEKRFKGLDADGNGEITKAEVVDALLLDDESELDQLWASADADGDGKITFEEFSKAADAFASMEAELDAVQLPGM